MSLLDRKLVKVEIAHLPHGSKVLIPTMKVPKELFSNVDTESGSGQALHLCRKHVNVQVVAHIIVGICAMFDMDRDGDELVFDLAIDYLYAGSENRVQAIQKVALNHNIRSTGILDCFLAELQNLYIQCIEIDPRESACEIIKIRSTMANDIPDQSTPALTRNTIPTKQLKGAELPEILHNSPKLLASLQNFLFSKAPLLARSFISTALDLSGIKATRLEIKDPPIGERVEQHLTEALALLEHCHHLYTHPDTPPSLKKLLNTIFFTEILINPDDNTPTSTPQRPIHPTPRPPFDQLTNPTLRHQAGIPDSGENRDGSEDTRRNDSNDHGNDDSRNDSNEGRSRNGHGGQGNNGTHVSSDGAHLDQAAARTATISPVAAIAATHSSADITSHPNQASTAATSRGSTARTATTQLPDNPKTLQEDLPEGGTHIHLGDVSCKSLVVGNTGLEPVTSRM